MRDASTAADITCLPLTRAWLRPAEKFSASPARASLPFPSSPSPARPSSSGPAPSPSGGLRGAETARPRRWHPNPCARARATARELLVRHFPAAEAQGHLRLVALVEEIDQL